MYKATDAHQRYTFRESEVTDGQCQVALLCKQAQEDIMPKQLIKRY